MQFTQLKAMEKNKREYLWSILEVSKVLRQFGEVLNLTDSDREAENEAIAVQDVTDLFSVVSNSPWFGRTKRTWYSPEYLYNLKELLQLFPSDHQKVRQVLKIPQTSFRRLKLETAEKMQGQRDREDLWAPIPGSQERSRCLFQRLSNLQQNRWHFEKFNAITSQALGWSPKLVAINDFVKNKLRYSYKRGSSRALACKRRETPYLQSIFWSRILAEIHKNQIAVNIDESSFSKSVKWNYSWLPKGESWPIVNANWTGTASVIFALMSFGE